MNTKSVTITNISNLAQKTPSLKTWIFEGTRNVNHTHLGKLRDMNLQGLITLTEN